MDKYEYEWTFPYFDNYTGPFWSNGKFQKSVANGDKKPKSKLDAISRDHDTAYALASNDADRNAADRVYYDSTRSMSVFPRAVGDIVYYGNKVARASPMDIIEKIVPVVGVLMDEVRQRNESILSGESSSGRTRNTTVHERENPSDLEPYQNSVSNTKNSVYTDGSDQSMNTYADQVDDRFNSGHTMASLPENDEMNFSSNWLERIIKVKRRKRKKNKVYVM